MKRRQFVSGAACAMLTPLAAAQAIGTPRFVRPDISTDEGGLWAMMDREETKLRRSPFIIRDAAMQAYIQEIVCRLAFDHCPDIRVHLVQNSNFNANMAPNGMMQVWSGLMLRMDNEAQLAAVLGHEIGHYLERHSVAMLRDLKSKSATAAFLSVFGLVGAIGGLMAVSGIYSFSRENERSADEIGLGLMSKAGYDPAEAAKVWNNLLLEAKADPTRDPDKDSIMFATHPAMDERKETLSRMAANLPKGETHEARWQEKIAPYRLEWLDEECKRGRFAQSQTLLTRLIERGLNQADYFYARAELFRLRGSDGDFDLAIKDYNAALSLGNEPAKTHRGLGLIYHRRGQGAQAKASFNRYMERAPQAPDLLIIKSYIEESKT